MKKTYVLILFTLLMASAPTLCKPDVGVSFGIGAPGFGFSVGTPGYYGPG
jgi:hypothetical protein